MLLSNILNNLAFRETKEKSYGNNNENFLSLIKIIVKFDHVMQKHVKHINKVNFKIITLVIKNKIK